MSLIGLVYFFLMGAFCKFTTSLGRVGKTSTDPPVARLYTADCVRVYTFVSIGHVSP